MASNANTNAWNETAFVTITAAAGSDVEFCSLTESIDIDSGERPIETFPVLCGGRIFRLNPEGETTVSLKAYPTEAGTDTGTTGAGFYDLFFDSVTTATGLVSADNTLGTRKKFRVAILWTNSTSATSAVGVLGSPANAGMRWVGRNGYLTKVTPSFAAGETLSYDVTFVFPARQKTQTTANIKVESIDGVGTATLTALTSYTAVETSGF